MPLFHLLHAPIFFLFTLYDKERRDSHELRFSRPEPGSFRLQGASLSFLFFFSSCFSLSRLLIFLLLPFYFFFLFLSSSFCSALLILFLFLFLFRLCFLSSWYCSAFLPLPPFLLVVFLLDASLHPHIRGSVHSYVHPYVRPSTLRKNAENGDLVLYCETPGLVCSAF